MFNTIISYVTDFYAPRKKAIWHTLWQVRDEQKAVALMTELFPLQATLLAHVTEHLTRNNTNYRLVTRESLSRAFWRDRGFDQLVTVQVPGPIVWDGPQRRDTIYDIKFSFKQGILVDLTMGLFIDHD